IRTLKIEYEQYFGGGRSRPPADTQWRVESLMRRYNERAGELNVGQRFRFNNLAQTYAKYVDMWRKKTIQKETGITQHHFGAAAKAVEAERARQAALHQAAEEAAGHAAASGAAGAHPESAAHAADKAVHARRAAEAFALSFSDPEHEEEKVHILYRKLIEARSETGEKAGAPSLRDFERFVCQKTKDLKEKGGHEIEYTVSIENGRVKLRARVSN
ncbi:MAG: MXAN_5187 C-terminal domain-containing protein, partial [Candidatus Acidiferrales bacterium]